jgi:hypothetical protein
MAGHMAWLSVCSTCHVVMNRKSSVTTFFAALAVALCSFTPVPAQATPFADAQAFLRDRKLLEWDRVVVEVGTFGIAGALVRFTSEENGGQELPYGIAIESARHGAMLSYRATF